MIIKNKVLFFNAHSPKFSFRPAAAGLQLNFRYTDTLCRNNAEIKMETNNLKRFLEEHFVYEVDMLYISLNHLVQAIRQNDNENRNLTLECFLLHYRNIIEFLFFDKKFPDDARAIEFIDRNEWSILNTSYTDDLKKLYTRACKEVDHLTYSRFYGTPPEKLWDCSKMFKQIINEIKKFLNYLPINYKTGEILRIESQINMILNHEFQHYIA